MAKFLGVDTASNSQVLSKSKLNIYDTIPRHILSDSENFIQLLQDYYEFLNEKGMPINVITNIVKNNDIDRVDDEFIDSLLSETMGDLPLNPVSNRKAFYKNIVDFYRTKGTIESFRTFFRVFFGDSIELYYPKNNTFTLGLNKWDANLKVPIFDDNNNVTGYKLGGWLNNQGMLSTTQYLTDGRYYQPYSYVIKSGTNISKWQYIFNKMCHPSGFVFYGEISIFIELLDVDDNYFKYPEIHPGFTRPSEQIQSIIIELLEDSPYTETVELMVRKILYMEADFTTETIRRENHHVDKYYSNTDIRQYYNLNVVEVDFANNEVGIDIIICRPIELDAGEFLEDESGNLILGCTTRANSQIPNIRPLELETGQFITMETGEIISI